MSRPPTTTDSGAIILCDSLRAGALAGLPRHLPVAGFVSTGGGVRTELPRFDDVTAALDAGVAEVVVILSPYRGMAADALLCRQRQVPVITAGPMPGVAQNRKTGYIEAAGRWRYHLTVQRLFQSSSRPAFGSPVYLRHIAGGGRNALGLWWAALEGLELIAGLLGTPRRLWVTATRGGGRWHATITVITIDEASAQLVITPTAVSGDEVMLLGTGGLLWGEGVREHVIEQTDGGSRLLADDEAWPDGRWAAAAIAGDALALQSSMDDALRQALLPALRRAARQRQPVSLV